MTNTPSAGTIPNTSPIVSSSARDDLYLIQTHDSIDDAPSWVKTDPLRSQGTPGDSGRKKRKPRSQRFEEQQQIKERLADALDELGDFAAARKVRECHATFNHYRCSNGHAFARPVKHCRNRLCPFCQRDTMKRHLARFGFVLDSLSTGHRGKYLVLAMKNTPLGFLIQGVCELWKAFRRLQGMPGMEPLKNAIVKLELTFNRDEQSWHPHLNVVFESRFLPFEELNKAWQHASRGGLTSFITEVNRGTARELLKYVCKSADFIDIPEAVQEFIQAMRGRQFLRCYGSFRGVGRPGDELGHIDDDSRVCCPDCGSQEVWQLGTVGFGDVVCDERGVLRIRAPEITCRAVEVGGRREWWTFRL